MDPSSQILLSQLPVDGRALWLADENQLANLPRLQLFASQLHLLSNRFNLTQQAQALGLTAHFSDWLLAEPAAYQHVFLRICKEKPTNFHLLNSALDWLAPEGTLHLSGAKDEGIKSIAAAAKTLFGSSLRLQKEGSAYWINLSKSSSPAATRLDTQRYQQLRPIADWRGRPLYSKPGVYGWNKVDVGSALLIEHANTWLSNNSHRIASCLDLGCGYGLLSLAFDSPGIGRRVATDNNAAALQCTAYNAQARGLSLEVLAGDCGDTVEGQFDLVVCNPPFHSGFAVDGDLTQRFLDTAQTRLAPGGTAFFVVNSFIALEQKAASNFRELECLAEAQGFKVFRLARPKSVRQ